MAPKVFRTPFNEYERQDQLGEGANGYVYEAIDKDGQSVAIKCLKPEHIERRIAKRFQSEILFGQRANHSNVVRVLDVGLVELKGQPVPFYVMPRYDKTLRDVIRSEVPSQRKLQIFGSILSGIEYAHLQGIWHRDLKPTNVLLSANLSDVVIADFGIAHFSALDHFEAVRTQSAERLANHQYCAPEQANQGSQVDHTADIYALGLILNELFTREVPRGLNHTLIAGAAPEFGYLDGVVERMIQQKPKERFQSIKALKEDISARSNIQLITQRVDQATKTVIPETEPDDPILANPIEIIGVDWQPGLQGHAHNLILNISQNAPEMWREIFARGPAAGVSIYHGSWPGLARWIGARTIHVPVSQERVAKEVLAQYRAHLEGVNRQYAEVVRRDHLQQLENQRAERKRLAEKEAARLRVLQSLQ